MNERQMTAVGILACAVVVAAVAQRTIRIESAVLGLSALELALIGATASAFVARQI